MLFRFIVEHQTYYIVIYIVHKKITKYISHYIVNFIKPRAQ